MDTFLQDLRFGARQLSRAKVVSIAAVLCIAIGVGANTTIFSVANAILMRPIPGVPDATGLLELGRAQAGEAPMDTMSYLNWRDIIDGTRDQVEIGLWTFAPLALSGDGEPEVVLGYSVTPGYFSVLDLQAERGRFFNDEEGRVEAAEPVVVISHGLWQRRYGGAEDVVGRTVRVNGTAATIVGVAPRDFGGHLSVISGDAWVPLGMRASGLTDQETLDGRFNSFLLAIGRLRPGVSLESAQAAGSAVMANLAREYPQLEGLDVGMAPLGSLPAFIQFLATLFLSVLMVVVGLVLMIACINVAGMLLSRGTQRRREIAVRLAIGAGRGRVVRQLLTESLLLFAIGGGLGVLAAWWTNGMLSALNPPTPPPFVFSFDVGLDARVLGFALLLTLATGVIFGIGPALRATRPDLVPALKDESISARRRTRLRAVLVGGQVAMTVLLLVAAGLFLRALVNARTIDPGFDPDGVITMSLELDLHGYDEEQGKQFMRDVREALAGVSGVEQSSFAALLPLGLPASISYGGVNVEGYDPPPNDRSWDADLNLVSPGYFDTLGIPLLQGRDFDDRDVESAPRVAIINEAMASHFWPDGDAVGSTFLTGSFENGTEWRVIGVARDSKYSSLTADKPFFTYMPLAQSPRSAVSLQVKVGNPATPPLDGIRAAIARIDPDLPFLDVVGLRDYVEIAYLPQRIAGTVAGVLGLVGLLLGAVGIYGVTAYAVSQRVREIGLRKALGAQRDEMVRMVVRQGMVAPLVGMAVGLAMALAVSRLLSAFLLGVSPLDPITFAGVFTVLVTVTLLANYLPARRAASVDPMTALHHE
ncbi:MAG: ABC transporter permease [Acidobacteriota bacterium]|jgi:predicted permease